MANMDSCIRCGLCHSVCPTYQETHLEEESPRGRIAMAKALAEGHLMLTPDLVRHEESCLMCDACTAICPAGFNMETMGLALRADLRDSGKASRTVSRAGLRTLADPRRLRNLGRVSSIFRGTGLRAVFRSTGMLKLLGLDRWDRLAPEFDEEPLLPEGQVWESVQSKGTVILWTGCVMAVSFPNVHRAAIRLLNAAGYTVTAPPQACCGALHGHNGALDDARTMARANIDALADTDGPILVDAAGCTAHLKNYADILAGDAEYAEKAKAFSARVQDAMEVFASLVSDLPLTNHPQTVTYQEACHLAHMQGIRQQPRDLLNAIPGLELTEMAESDLCCGSAGIYNVLQPDMSDRLGERKAHAIVDTGAVVVAAGNPGCILQMRAALGRSDVRVAHVLELLDEACVYEER